MGQKFIDISDSTVGISGGSIGISGEDGNDVARAIKASSEGGLHVVDISYDSVNLLTDILEQLKIANIHLSELTDNIIENID